MIRSIQKCTSLGLSILLITLMPLQQSLFADIISSSSISRIPSNHVEKHSIQSFDSNSHVSSTLFNMRNKNRVQLSLHENQIQYASYSTGFALVTLGVFLIGVIIESFTLAELPED